MSRRIQKYLRQKKTRHLEPLVRKTLAKIFQRSEGSLVVAEWQVVDEFVEHYSKSEELKNFPPSVSSYWSGDQRSEVETLLTIFKSEQWSQNYYLFISHQFPYIVVNPHDIIENAFPLACCFGHWYLFQRESENSIGLIIESNVGWSDNLEEQISTYCQNSVINILEIEVQMQGDQLINRFLETLQALDFRPMNMTIR